MDVDRGAHHGAARRGWEDAPRAIVVSEEYDGKPAGLASSFNANIAAQFRPHLAEARHPHIPGVLLSEPRIDDPT